ncbi:ABC transporter permease [Vallitalea pronyensis]|uniref:ABC transporter permease n=1 Tax=Vallitalea pronyensis TaxID=1348613 RepID=A0A8J8SGI9_9FIRM|nr:ABC transporter permease [Vallitalea pronyensis]QUI22439.1 ABC transporter permease [Vallitalea pronyensis]
MSAKGNTTSLQARFTDMDDKKVVGKLFDKAGVYVIALCLIAFGILVEPSKFLTPDNLLNILRSVGMLGITACGLSFVIYSSQMADMSVPSAMAFSGIITVQFLYLGLVPALILGIIFGMLIGLVNGIVVGYIRANAILWTLAMQFGMEGIMRYVWSGNQLYPDLEPGTSGALFVSIFRTNIGPIPLLILVMIVLYIIADMVMKKTKFGNQLKLVGSAYQVAKCTGIHVKKTVLIAFLISSFTASIAGIFITSMNKLGVFYLGEGYDFKSVTAIVIGGMALSGGRGSVWGALGGVLVIGLLNNILTFIGIPTAVQNVFVGLVFIAVVALHTYKLRKAGKDFA